ncbi:hypothetical protein [Bacillus sp. T33-2]|uniref:hypothetical protein n=1 Tax=Bacillus sp. T33-2 TaxID=2054168 RepID=UPI000C76EAE2|nr:hypothetical protein [Bacillus sp. T33-2]PLR99583.1 hypothetical protein CVD19_00540 [Bacillus sp. T33-2]
MELETKKVSRFKSKVFWLKVVGLLVLLSIFYNIGVSGAKITLEEKKVNYDELVKEIRAKEKEVDETKQKIADVEFELKEIEEEFNAKQAEFEEAKKVVENKQSIENDIAKLNSDLETKKGEIAAIDANIKAKNDELASITGQIQEKKDAPKQLPAGNFTVGKDIPAGRYKVVPVGQGSNFIVYSGSGRLKVNTILGSFGVGEYVFDAAEGDNIQTEAPAKFIAVE